MNELTRRNMMALTAGAIVSPLLPGLPAPAAAAPVEFAPLPAWVVGTPDEFDWQHITAATREGALRQWVLADTGFFCDEPGARDPETGECYCDGCHKLSGIEAERVPAFDGIDRPTPGDWMMAGMGHFCSRCGYETHGDADGHAVRDEAVCEDCMTLADWDIVDPEHAAELRAELAEA